MFDTSAKTVVLQWLVSLSRIHNETILIYMQYLFDVCMFDLPVHTEWEPDGWSSLEISNWWRSELSSLLIIHTPENRRNPVVLYRFRMIDIVDIQRNQCGLSVRLGIFGGTARSLQTRISFSLSIPGKARSALLSPHQRTLDWAASCLSKLVKTE